MSDIWENEEIKEWADAVLNDMAPKVQDSAVVASLWSGKSDVKLWVELGVAICPTCGGNVRVVSSDDGTSYYEPLDPHRVEGELEALRQLAEWLICMDDAEDAYGSAERRTVTLTKIIDRAKLALRGEVPASVPDKRKTDA
jgi:hypothetical protein